MDKHTLDLGFFHDMLHVRLVRDGVDPASIPDKITAKMRAALGHNDVPVEFARDRARDIARNQAQLERLKALPVIEQRTPEWYAARNTLVTASDVGQAIGKGKFGTVREFVQKKCGHDEPPPFNYSCPPLKWGTMYEPVATALYEDLTKQKVHEFGLLRHPTIDWFGCSPDGINDLGVALEIKCPYKRVITRDVPEQYYIQIQGQLEVCGIDTCDFLEVTLKEFTDEAEFLRSEGDVKGRDRNGNAIGVVVEAPAAQGFKYLYSEWGTSAQECAEWAKSIPSPPYDRKHFYRVERYQVQRVVRDDVFIKNTLETVGDVWKKVLHYRDNKAAYDAYMSGGGSGSGSGSAANKGWRRRSAPPPPAQPNWNEYAFVDSD